MERSFIFVCENYPMDAAKTICFIIKWTNQEKTRQNKVARLYSCFDFYDGKEKNLWDFTQTVHGDWDLQGVSVQIEKL